MPKHLFLLSGILIAILALAAHPYPSLAELRSAATPAQGAFASAGSKLISGPHRRRVTKKPVVLEIDQPKSILEKILDASGIMNGQRALVGGIMGMLDDACLEKLETFVVMYDSRKRRGLAGKGVILIRGDVPDKELAGLLIHEGLGHFRDITCITGTEESGASAFRDGDDAIYNDDPSVAFYGISWVDGKTRKTGAKREDFVTGYAYEGDNFEDLAESVTYYMTREGDFRLRAASNAILARKLVWLETHMPKTRSVAESGRPSWDGIIAWDATKLAFTWARE